MINIPTDRPFVFDGAFGTYYASLYPSASRCEEANIEYPERVISIHREYIAAGADAIKTNTFTLNKVTVTDSVKLDKLISGAVSCALAACDGKADVFADIGTIPGGSAEDYIELADIFIKHGAKNFLFETFAEFSPLSEVLTYIKRLIPDSTVIVCFGAAPDGYTRHGFDLHDLISEASAHPATDAVGFNCICGPAHAARLSQTISYSQKPICVMPNAGYPANENGRTVYNDNINYYADKINRIYSAGARILGGCCGTTPAHIAASVAAIKHQPFSAAEASVPLTAQPSAAENPLALKLASGKKVIAVELDPPADPSVASLVSAAAELKNAGCDVITFADNPLSRARADSFMTASYISSQVGISVMPHLTCRDRNHIAIKSSLLAANAMGVRNVLAVTGDPLSDEEYHGKSVFALNSFKLIGYISSLNSKEFSAAPFLIGGALNLNATNFDAELSRAERKLAGGASLFLTQPVASERSLENLKKAHTSLNARILAGLYPVASYKNALFLKNEVSGMDIPDSLLSSLEGKNREEAARISVSFTSELATRISEYCDGFYLMTPLKRTDIITALIQKLKELMLI